MHCFCFAKFKEAKGDINKVFGISFTNIAPGDTTKYCQGWFWAYSEAMALKYGAPMVIVIINSVVPIIFDLLTRFESHKTKTLDVLSLPCRSTRVAAHSRDDFWCLATHGFNKLLKKG